MFWCLNRALRVHPFASRSLGLLVLTFALAAPAAAQREAGPNAGVLGAPDDASARHTLTFRGSLFSALEDITHEDDDPSVNPRFLRSGLAGGAEGGLNHARRTARTRWLSSANTALRVYGSDDDAAAVTFAGRTDLHADLNTRVTATVAGGLSYSPYYELAPSYGTQTQSITSFDGGFGVATAAERNVSTDGNAGINVRLSRRDTFDAGANVRRWEFLDQSDGTVTSYGGHARYRHALTGTLGVYAGFGREQADYQLTDASDLTSDTIDVGIDFGDVLEFSRRTALSFSFSTAAFRWEDNTHWRVNGSAALTRALGRSGSGLLRYERATESAGGFREPLLMDTFGGGFSNQVGRNTSWSVNAGYVRGEIGFESASRRFNIYDASGRVTRALTRHLGIFGDYTYYRYEVPAGSTVFTFLPKFSRQSVTAGLTLWAPVINDARPPREIR